MGELAEFAIVHLAIPANLVWDFTPHEIYLTAKAKKEQNKNELIQTITLAHTIESLARTKKLPKLNVLLKRIDKPKQNSLGDIILRKMAEEKGVKV